MAGRNARGYGKVSARRLGIIAGQGSLPTAVAEAALRAGQDVHILGLEGCAGPEIRRFPHSFFRMEQIRRMFSILRREKCGEVVFIGGVKRPDLGKIRPDLGLVLALPFIIKLTFGGDDHLLSRIIDYIEGKGFVVKGAHQIAPELLCEEGVLGRYRPGRGDVADITTGLRVVQRMGDLDIGQGAVVARSHILAVEAAEGTDAMLTRCRNIKQWGLFRRSGVLVKCPKPGQELRIDMPTIGPDTVERAARAGLRGIAVAAGQTLIADRAALIAAADHHKMFVQGIKVADAHTSQGRKKASPGVG